MSTLKLEFETEPLCYYRKVLEETRHLEEGAESLIPDTGGEALEVLHTGGVCLIRAREVRDGAANLSLAVRAAALIRMEGRAEPEVAEAYIPMSLQLESGELKPGQAISVRARLRRLEGRIPAPGRVSLRAAVTAEITVWEQVREEHPLRASGGAEVLTEPVALKLMTGWGETTDLAEDTLPLDTGEPLLSLADCRLTVTTLESRLTGTRALLRGEVGAELLGKGERGQLLRASCRLPFSQYVDLGACGETDELLLKTDLASCDPELGEDGMSLRLQVQLRTEARVFSTLETERILDLYSPEGETELQWSRQDYESLLDRQYLTLEGRGLKPEGGETVLETIPRPGPVQVRREGELAVLDVPVTVEVLSGDETGIRSDSLELTLSARTRADPEAVFETEITELGCTARSGPGGVDVHLSGILCLRCFGTRRVQEVAAAEIREDENRKRGPGLILRRTAPGQTLWDIAKSCRSTRAAIRSANGLEGEPEPDRLLLIPCPGRGH